MSDNIATVKAIYEAFQRGDVPAILEHVAEDARWEDFADSSAQKAGVPWLLARNGKAEVVGFFQVLGTMRFDEFNVLNLMAGGDSVAVELVVDATTAAGAHFRDEEMHLFTFDAGGKVVRFRHYTDTVKHIAAAAKGA